MSANGAKVKRKNQGQKHTVVSREEWIAARKKFLKSDTKLTRRSDEAIL